MSQEEMNIRAVLDKIIEHGDFCRAYMQAAINAADNAKIYADDAKKEADEARNQYEMTVNLAKDYAISKITGDTW